MNFFDAHFHIVDTRFPLVENQGFLPASFEVTNYLNQIESDYTGGTVVSGSFQAFDYTYLLDALKKLGKNYYGVANIPVNITDTELKTLNNAGVVGVRFNFNRNMADNQKDVIYLAHKLLNEFGWHTELYLDSLAIPELCSLLNKLPRFSIDHLGLSAGGLNDLYHWVEKGMIVKATGFGRIDFDPIPAMNKIYNINPDALIFGTDLPSTRAKRPFLPGDITLIEKNFSEAAQEKIFYKNAISWYAKP